MDNPRLSNIKQQKLKIHPKKPSSKKFIKASILQRFKEGVTVTHTLQKFITSCAKSISVKQMPCPYLTKANNCIAKPYGDEGHVPKQQIIESYCNNEITMYDCRRAIIYEAYLKSGGK